MHESDNDYAHEPHTTESPTHGEQASEPLTAVKVKQEMSPLPENTMYIRPSRKYQPSSAMLNVCETVLPHMVHEVGSHTHPLDETIYGGTLTLDNQEVSYGDVVYGKTDSFVTPFPHMFRLIGGLGKSKLNEASQVHKTSFPSFNKARRKSSLDKYVKGTQDLSKLKMDVVMQQKSSRGRLNATMQEPAAVTEQVSIKQESEGKVDQQANLNETSESLFSGKEVANESDYFASAHESEVDGSVGSPVFTSKNQLPAIPKNMKNEDDQADTSNEVIAATQVESDPITTLGLVEVDNLSSPIIPSGQVQHDESTVSAPNGSAPEISKDDQEEMEVSYEHNVPDSSQDPDADTTFQPFQAINASQSEEIEEGQEAKFDDTSNIDEEPVETIKETQEQPNMDSSGIPACEIVHDKNGDQGVGGGGSPENTIYNQEVLKLNKNLFVEKDVGSDCLIQAEGQSKVVVSVQSDLEKMKLVQKLFREAACFKGWSAEITKIPLVSLKKCKVEVVTEKDYNQYVATVDGNLDVCLQGGGEGGDPDMSNTDNLDKAVDGDEGPSLEFMSQVLQSDVKEEPKKIPTARKRTGKTSKQPKKSKVSDDEETSTPLESHSKKSRKSSTKTKKEVPTQESPTKKSQPVKRPSDDVKPSTSGLEKKSKFPKKSSKTGKSSVVVEDNSNELLLESLLHSEQMETDTKQEESRMLNSFPS